MTVFVIDLPLLLENGGEIILFMCYVNGTKVKGNYSRHVYTSWWWHGEQVTISKTSIIHSYSSPSP